MSRSRKEEDALEEETPEEEEELADEPDLDSIPADEDAQGSWTWPSGDEGTVASRAVQVEPEVLEDEDLVEDPEPDPGPVPGASGGGDRDPGSDRDRGVPRRVEGARAWPPVVSLGDSSGWGQYLNRILGIGDDTLVTQRVLDQAGASEGSVTPAVWAEILPEVQSDTHDQMALVILRVACGLPAAGTWDDSVYSAMGAEVDRETWRTLIN